MTRIPANAVRTSPSSSAQPVGTLAPAKPRAVDLLTTPRTGPSATQKFAELKASIPEDLIGHGSDGEPFFTLGSLKAKPSEAEMLAALAPKLFSKRSETADRHDFLPATGDEALRAFTGRADSLREQVPEESLAAYDAAIASTQALFFNKSLFTEIRAVDTSTHGAQYGREALTLMAHAKSGQWFFVALEIVG